MSGGAERSATLDLSRWSRPIWRRPGHVAAAAAALALAPALGAVWVRFGPGGAPPRAPEPTLEPAPRLEPLTRTAPDPAPLAAIASGNLFTPGRADWALASAPAPGPADADAASKRRAERRKQADEDIERLTFVATIRAGDEWSAIVDTPERRAPVDDLTTLRVGGEYKGWTVREIGRDFLALDFDGEVRTLALLPRLTTRQAAAPALGRSRVEVRPAPGGVRIDPPIPPDEAKRRLMDAAGPDDAKLRGLIDELMESLEHDRRSPPRREAPPPAVQEKKT